MKCKFLSAALIAAVLVINMAAPVFADVTANRRDKVQTNQLVSMLPASDAVVTLNGRRFFNEGLPKIFVGSQKTMTDILAKVDQWQAKTGIDLRRFEYIAAGITHKKLESGKYSFDPVIIARGEVTSDAVISAAKTAADGKYREERFDGKVVYIFATTDLAKADPASTANSRTVANKVASQMKDVAIAALGPNTVVFGDPVKVRATLEGSTKVGADLVSMLNRKEISIANMAARSPAGLGVFLPLDNDVLGRSLDSVRYVFGSIDMVGDTMVTNLTARTETAANAKALYSTFEAMKTFGGMALAGSARPDQRLYARLLNNAKLTHSEMEVALDLTVPQSDLSELAAILNK